MSADDSAMSGQLTRDNLHGVWAAVPTPFDADDRFDGGVLRENMRRLHAAGVHGIYINDADGEFYAIELEEFARIVDVFADEAQRLGVPTQVGVTATSTQGTVDRLRHAASKGILGAHVGHPHFMPMTARSLDAFWADVAAAVPAEFGLIHYNSMRMPNYLRGIDYAALATRLPNLIGTKQVKSDFAEFTQTVIQSPQLSHFTSEHSFVPNTMHGARGIYSWFANFNARWLVDWYELIQAKKWDEAVQRQLRMSEFMRASELLHEDGNDHAIVGKAVSAASDFLVPMSQTRRPYLPISPDLIQQFRDVTVEQFPDMIWHG